MVEADPVDSLTFAAGIAVAQLDPPKRRTSFPHVFQSAFHGVLLAVHAPRVPAAHEAHIENYRIIEGWRRSRPGVGRDRSGGSANCGSDDCPPHIPLTDELQSPPQDSATLVASQVRRSGN